MSESRYAVLIGNSDFPLEPKLAPLRCPGNDVDGLREILSSSSYGGFDKVIILKNETHHEALLRIDQVFHQADQDDLVLIYYSGHGKQDMEGQLYLASANTQVRSLRVTSIPVEQIRGIIRNSKANKIVLILDCCYSGAAGGAFLRSDVDTELARISKSVRGTYILAASTSLQTAVEREGDEYGLLTKHILEGIKSGGAARDDGLVTIDTLYQYVYHKISSESHQEPTKYEFDVKGSDLIISRTGRISRDEWRKRARRKIYELDLPPRIEELAVKVIHLNLNQLSRKQACYNDLLNRLLTDELTVPEFIDQWYAAGERIDQINELYRRGQGAADTGSWDNAIGDWKKILELDPDNEEASAKLQHAQLKKQELAERIKSIYVRARTAMEKEKWNDAVVQWKALIELEPGNQKTIRALAEAQRKQKDLKAQIGGIYRAAQSAMDRDDWDVGVGHWQALLQLDPNHEEAKTKLKQAQLKKQELAERINSIYRQAKAAVKQEDWKEAVVQWQALIELEPGNKEAINALAEAQRKQKDLEAQIGVSYFAAQRAMEHEDWDAAIGHWHALLQLDPNHEEAKTKLRQAQFKKQEAPSALKEASNALDQTPEKSTGVESPPPGGTQETANVEVYDGTPKAEQSDPEQTQPALNTGAEAISPLAHFWSSSPVQDATSYIASLRKEPKKCPKCNKLFPLYKFCSRDATPLVFRSFGARLLVLPETLVAKLRKQPRWFLPVVLGGILLLLSLIFASVWILYFRNQELTNRTNPPAIKPEQEASAPAGPPLSSFSFPTFSVNTNGEPTTTQVEKTAHGFSLKLSDDLYLEMVYIPGGEFTIGSTGREMDLARPGEAYGPEITVKPFYLGKYEVTREEWAAVAKWPKIHQELNPNPSKALLKDQTANINRLPVDNVTWSEAREFAERLSTKALQCTLPSEAEWEYACRAGTVSPFAFSESVIRDSINYNGMERTQEPITHRTILTTKPVGSFNLANNFGLFDMHGNLWEWCLDLWHDNYKGIPNDAKPWTTGEGKVRVVRGGAWAYPLSASRSATRYSQHEEHKGVSMGLRVACYVQ